MADEPLARRLLRAVEEGSMNMGSFLQKLQATGGLLRVRAVLALGLTGIGGAFLLIHEAMPPGEFIVIWASATAFYFGNRAAEGANGNPPAG